MTWSAFKQVGLGLLSGIPRHWLRGWLMVSQLFGVKLYDPAMPVTAMAALIAALIPAQLAASVDPMKALRTE